MEQWKPIPGFEGLYEASNLGRVRSAPGKTTSNARYKTRVWKSRIMKQKHPVSKGRPDYRVTLWKDGKESDHLVSRLIAAAWHGSPEKGMTVNHINGDFRDNRQENLEWVTVAENIKHGFEHGLYASIQKAVSLADIHGNTKEYPSFAAASRSIGRNNKCVATAISRNQWHVSSADGSIYAISLI